MKFRSFIFAPVLAACLCAFAGVVPASPAGWVSVRSKNFYLAGDAGEAEMRSVAERLEQFREAFGQVMPKLNLNAGIRTNVLVFNDSASYRPFKPLRPDGTPDDQIAGYFIPGDDVNYITLSIGNDKGDPYRTIFHEYVHFLLRANFGETIPPWLDEGLAQYYETMQIAGGNRIMLGGVPDDHLRLIKRSTLIPFDKFFTVDNSSLHANGDAPRNLFYAQAWAFAHYLIHKDGGADRAFALLSRGQNPFIGKNEELSKLLRVYVDQPSLPVSEVPFQRAFSTTEAGITTAPISDAQAHAFLGDLLLRAERLGEAEKYLKKAIGLDRNSPHANLAFGLLLMRQDKYTEAKKHLEISIARDGTNHLAFFNYAYALSRESENSKGEISEYSPTVSAEMRSALNRAIQIEPRFAESYRLLAFLNFMTDQNLEEAVTLLRKGLSLKPADPDFEILLARVLLTQEKHDEARQIADKLVRSAVDAGIRRDAEDILRTVGQYVKARAQVDITMAPAPWAPSLVFLKRSWLTPADIDRIERDREINNLNRAIGTRRPDEKLILGRIQNVTCANGNITYSVLNSEAKNITLTSPDFQSLRMAVLLEGQNSFQIDCGVSLAKYLTVLSIRPGAKDRIPGLTSITFVPDYFKLKSPVEMLGVRMVVVEEDTLRRSGTSGRIERLEPDLQTRQTAITANLRPVQQDETRVMGTMETIECEGSAVYITALVGDKKLRMQAAAPTGTKFSWFGVEASQIPLICGTQPSMPNTLFTFTGDTTLKAVEFVPAGFKLEN